MQVKIDVPVSQLCSELPTEFETYLSYCRSLHFEDEPDYNYLKHLFRECMRANNYTFDLMFDWLVPNEQA
jgi:hypothetical protein